MVVRAAESDVLSASTHERMLTERPGARSLEVEGGHPPPLNVPEQVAPIREFLA
jgi:hypothetical protein